MSNDEAAQVGSGVSLAAGGAGELTIENGHVNGGEPGPSNAVVADVAPLKVVVPAPSGWCKCRDDRRQLRMPFRDRMIFVEDRDGFREACRVSQYCGTCRGVLLPLGIVGRLLESEHRFEVEYHTARAKARAGIGKPLGKPMLTSWDEATRFFTVEQIEPHQLYDGWSAYKNQPSMIAEQLRLHHGIAQNGLRKVETPIGEVQIDERLARHALDVKFPRRLDVGHLSFAPFTVPTLKRPLEIFEAPEQPPSATDPGSPPAYHFFCFYRLRGVHVLHTVIVHKIRGHAITAYTIEQADGRYTRLREGCTLRFSALDEPNQKSRS